MIGYDFGTDSIKVACIDPAGQPSIVNNDRGESATPTSLYVPATGPILHGQDAIEQGLVDPAGYVCNVKQALGSTASLLAGRMFNAVDAAAELIAVRKRDIERVTGVRVDEAVATVPANWRDDQKDALQEAFERNGIKVLSLRAEPSSAGIAYGKGKPEYQGISLVYDFGGGTFDVSVIRIEGEQIEVMATDGVPSLGGNDIDQCIMDMVLQVVERQCGERPAQQAEPHLYADLNLRVKTAKHSLATRPEVPVVVYYQGQQVIVTISQQQFRQAIDPLVRRSLDTIDRAVSGANITLDQVVHCLMVGGTSRLRYIQESVEAHLGLAPRMDIDPQKAVAYGAAVDCLSELSRAGKTLKVNGQVIPRHEVFVRDVTAHDVGCAVLDRSKQGALVNAAIITKNTPIPCRETKQFYLEHDNQTEARIEILQGDDGRGRDECLLIGELHLQELPSESTRSQRMRVEYEIDSNGMVTARAWDEVSGKSQSVSVSYKNGVKPLSAPSRA